MGNRIFSRKHKERMDVILGTIDDEGGGIVFAKDCGEVAVELWFDGGGDDILAVLCAEDEVYED